MLIGIGGNGKVYKGKLSNGAAVAVKVSRKDEYSFYGRWEQFLPMVEVISHIRHRNIVQVIGYCINKDSVLLVTKYAPNGSLWGRLVDPVEKESSVLNWDIRAAICIGIAQGLSYLHTDAIPHIIHLDIKSSTIVLDHNFSPQIIDFDGSKFIDELKESETYEAPIRGTIGYMDPMYGRTGEYSPKSDVYSFGMIMLEIISRRKVLEMPPSKGLIDIISKYLADGKHLKIIDPVLTDAATDEVRSFIDVAFLCLQSDPKRRPSMLEVWQMLYGVCNSVSRSFTRPDMSMVVASFKFRQVSPEEDEEHDHSTGVNLLALTCTSNLVEGGSSISLSSTAETSTTQERVYQTMAFKKLAANYDFSEAMYPPFLTSVYRRRNSVGFRAAIHALFFPLD